MRTVLCIALLFGLALLIAKEPHNQARSQGYPMQMPQTDALRHVTAAFREIVIRVRVARNEPPPIITVESGPPQPPVVQPEPPRYPQGETPQTFDAPAYYEPPHPHPRPRRHVKALPNEYSTELRERLDELRQGGAIDVSTDHDKCYSGRDC